MEERKGIGISKEGKRRREEKERGRNKKKLKGGKKERELQNLKIGSEGH